MVFIRRVEGVFSSSESRLNLAPVYIVRVQHAHSSERAQALGGGCLRQRERRRKGWCGLRTKEWAKCNLPSTRRQEFSWRLSVCSWRRFRRRRPADQTDAQT